MYFTVYNYYNILFREQYKNKFVINIIHVLIILYRPYEIVKKINTIFIILK
jgi:hypothetical protein